MKDKKRGKKLSKSTKILSKVLLLNHKQLVDFTVFDSKPKNPYKRIPKDIKLYLEIESELLKLSEEKLDEYSTTVEDYANKLLYSAMERAVGNLLGDILDDNKFQTLLDKKIKSAGHIYYKVAYKYKLPTVRIVPFLLGLIS